MKKVLAIVFAAAAACAIASCASAGPDQAAAKPAAASPAPSAAAAPPAVSLALDNFEGANSGGVWECYDDVKDNKGSSKANPDPWAVQAGAGANGSAHFGACWGTVTTKYQYGFGGVGYDFFPRDKGTPDKDKKTLDLNAYKGIHFWFKGDGKDYTLSIKSPKVNGDFCYYFFQLTSTPDWKEYTVDFSKFHQFSWGAATSKKQSFANATGFQFQTIGQPIDKFEFGFDEFSLY